VKKRYIDRLIDEVADHASDGDLLRVRDKIRDRTIALIEREKEEFAKEYKLKLAEAQRAAGALRLELQQLEDRIGSSGV
jgi:hypothetical protein